MVISNTLFIYSGWHKRYFLQNLKQSKLLNSFRKKLVFAFILLAISISLFFILKSKYPGKDLKTTTDSTITSTANSNEKIQIKQIDIKLFQANLDNDIDSILAAFGIRKDWVSTFTPQQKAPITKPTAPTAKTTGPKTTAPKTSTPAPKRNPKEAQWFVKDVIIPRDLASAEINLDISLYVAGSGYLPEVNEDIKTKDIIIDIKSIADSSSTTPLARIYITHSDKISRETGTFCLILSNLGDYKKDEIDKVLGTTSEFTFTFPRSLENIELQNRLVQLKKGIVINLTESAKDNSGADFTTLDDKDIKQKVKSFGVDYPGVTKVLLTKMDAQPLPTGLTGKIIEEYQKYNIRVINDSMLTPLFGKADEDSKDKIKIIINNIKTKAAQTGKGIAILNLNFDDFTKLCSELLTLKKLGYKFYTLTDYLSKEAERKRKEELASDKDAKDKPVDKKVTGKTDKKPIKPTPKVKTQKPNVKKK